MVYSEVCVCVCVGKIGVFLPVCAEQSRCASVRQHSPPRRLKISVSAAMKAAISGNNYCQNISNLDVTCFDRSLKKRKRKKEAALDAAWWCQFSVFHRAFIPSLPVRLFPCGTCVFQRSHRSRCEDTKRPGSGLPGTAEVTGTGAKGCPLLVLAGKCPAVGASRSDKGWKI